MPSPKPSPSDICGACGHRYDDVHFHLEAPGTNWGAALHHFVPIKVQPDHAEEICVASDCPDHPTKEPQRECIRCDWKGPESETVHPKHSPEDKLCPKCYEVTEITPSQHIVSEDEQRENLRKSLEYEMMPTTTPAPSQPAVTLDRETFDRLIVKGESIKRAAVHGTFYHMVAIELLALLRAAEGKK